MARNTHLIGHGAVRLTSPVPANIATSLFSPKLTLPKRTEGCDKKKKARKRREKARGGERKEKAKRAWTACGGRTK